MFFFADHDSNIRNQSCDAEEEDLQPETVILGEKRIKPVLEKLIIRKFRDLPEGEIPIGKAITILAGRNATGKSTILGMLGQPFGGRGSNLKDLFGNLMAAKFSQILKMDEEKAGDHEYLLAFYEPVPPYKEVTIPVKSKPRRRLQDGSTVGLRFVTGHTHKKGEGNLDVPVAYLGLRRLDPIGENKKISHETAELSTEEISYFNDAYRKIMGEPCLSQSCNLISGYSGKKTLSITPANYSPLSISAGQDNIGRIIAAILSIRRLKDDPTINYYGGLVLIDELDASLHPASLYSLIDCMYDWSSSMGIQFIFSTHSLDLLDYIYRYKRGKKKSTEIIYFSKPYGKVELAFNPTPHQIRSDLKLLRPNYGQESAISVYCEDSVARCFFECLIQDTEMANYIQVVTTRDYGASELHKAAWAFRCIPELERAIFVVDGDKPEYEDEKNTIIALPGSMAPEAMALKYIKNNRLDNPVFANHPKGLTLSHLLVATPLDSENNIDIIKKWFAKEFNDEYLRNWIWSSYKTDHVDEVDVFLKKFKIALNLALRAAKLETID